MDKDTLNWINAVAEQTRAFLEGKTVSDVAKALSIPIRDLNRIKNGLNERDLRIVNGTYYAILYYHANITKADPRQIPGTDGHRNRAWTERDYLTWQSAQPIPLFLDENNVTKIQIELLTERLESVLLGDPDVREQVARDLRTELHVLNNIIRILLLPPAARARELDANKTIHALEGE